MIKSIRIEYNVLILSSGFSITVSLRKTTTTTLMNFNRISNKVTNTFILDPYATLMHYRRCFKLLKQLKDNKSPILAVGNKNQQGFDWKNNFDGIKHAAEGPMSESVLAAACKSYHLIMCFDPILYAKALQGINLPIMMVASAEDISKHPEILQVSDYLLPAPSGRADAALRQLVYGEVFQQKKQTK